MKVSLPLLCWIGVKILDRKVDKKGVADNGQLEKAYELYLCRHDWTNNWDLADLAPLWFIRRRQEIDDVIDVTVLLIDAPEDLVNKATGGVLWEVGKNVQGSLLPSSKNTLAWSHRRY